MIFNLAHIYMRCTIDLSINWLELHLYKGASQQESDASLTVGAPLDNFAEENHFLFLLQKESLQCININMNFLFRSEESSSDQLVYRRVSSCIQFTTSCSSVRYQLFCTADLSPLFYHSRNICSRSCPHFFRSATKPPIATHPPLSPWRKEFYCPTFYPSWTKVIYNN